MKTLRQILEKKAMLPYEEYKKLEQSIIDSVKEWLQQKQHTVIPLHKEMQIGFNKAINELLEELKK